MLRLGASGHLDRIERLDRRLSGDPSEPDDADLAPLLMAAAALTPKRPVSQAARTRALAAMLREADRVTRTPAAAPAAEDTAAPGVHVRVASAGNNMRLRVADIEDIPEERLTQIAENLVARLGQRAPDRNP
ncbi:hypothetical protein AB0H51_27830 [Streptomyces griseoluteus]|uniref:hypothetical protein n=1 Tax=Streptomyces griseoluteus TaxID=29306 RepID=UPI0033E11B8A